MAILKIARMGHPVLAARAGIIADPTAPEIRRLVDDMVETMHDASGTGLAAPQVHVPLRLVVFEVAGPRAAAEGEEPPVGLTVLVNPVIEPLGPEQAIGWEGCLSLPGFMGAVPRYTRIRYRALDLSGAPIERVAAGFHARVVQHECDHLDGLLYPMRMSDLTRFGYVEEMQKRMEPGDERAVD